MYLFLSSTWFHNINDQSAIMIYKASGTGTWTTQKNMKVNFKWALSIKFKNNSVYCPN